MLQTQEIVNKIANALQRQCEAQKQWYLQYVILNALSPLLPMTCTFFFPVPIPNLKEVVTRKRRATLCHNTHQSPYFCMQKH